MKLYFYVLVSFILLGFVPKSWAQEGHFQCGQDTYMKQLWADNPQLKEDYKQLFENAKQVDNDGFQSKTTFVIPVVFHIIHEYGAENISDAQVYDQMDVLNRDYAMLNADLSQAVAGFDTLAGNPNIQFKLAAIDPWGNCTNGIDRIYSHLTNDADDYSKLNQWPRSRYLNVWVVRTIGKSGAAGYAYYPVATDGGMFFADGIILLSQYIGRVGSGNEFRSRALTHEIGHYLALPHVWGDNNDAAVVCGDDGIEDTPVTKGYLTCPTPSQAMNCVDSIVENYQNYMDYSYCSIMFTKGQVNIMRNVLQGESGNRNMLVSDSIHHLTGIDLVTVPQCAPVAEFSIDNPTVCVGGSVKFKDQSWNSVVDNREWSFQDADITTSTSAMPTVVFNSSGWKKVTLTVSNAAGGDTKTIDKAIYVYPAWSNVDGPKQEDFETSTANWFTAINPELESPGFELVWNKGVNNSTCYALINYKKITNSIQYSNDYFYNLRKGGSKDYLYTPTYDLRYTSGAELTFDYAYASEAFEETDITEVLELQSSTDCGKNWIPRKTLKKVDLLTGGNSSDINFEPNSSQWKNVSVSIPAALQKANVLFRFAFTASDLSNNLYIDNVNINGTLMTSDEEFSALQFNVYPNPSIAGEEIVVEYVANDKEVTLELLDLSGKLISTEVISSKNTNVTHKMNTTSNLTAGVYLVKISQGANQLVKKVVIL